MVLDDALALWRGTPYADWPDAGFARPERIRLDSLHDDGVCARLEARLLLGGHHEAVPQLQMLVSENPLREELWSMLAVALYRSGRQADALAAVQQARHLLVEELGVSPGPLLSRTERALLHQDVSLDVPRQRGPADANDAGKGAPRAACASEGRAAYGPEDAALVRDRDSLVERLLAALGDKGLLVVSGSSGAGQSSVVRAGLLPALARGGRSSRREGQQRHLDPGPHAVDELAGRAEATARDRPVVVVVDDLGHQWSAGMDPAERDAFLETLLDVVEGQVRARLVLVVPGDHLARLADSQVRPRGRSVLSSWLPR